MIEQGLSVRDIKAIGRARYDRLPAKWWLVVFAVLAIVCLVGGMALYIYLDVASPWYYTLPSGERVEWKGNELILDNDAVVELDTPRPSGSIAIGVLLLGLGLILYPLVYQGIHIRRAAKYTLAEWLAAGYRPKSDG